MKGKTGWEKLEDSASSLRKPSVLTCENFVKETQQES
jgi:hypothetical protein